MDIQARLTELAMLGATWVMWLLVALSIFALAIILERVFTLATAREDAAELERELIPLVEKGDIAAACARLDCSPALEARVVRAGLAGVPGDAAGAEQRLAAATQIAKLGMEKRLAFLGTLGANAPFVGLLGTVIGIIRAFHQLQASAGKVSAGLMSEVGEALVATAIGILVALPAVAAFNAFQRVIKVRLARADALGRLLHAALPAPVTRPAVEG